MKSIVLALALLAAPVAAHAQQSENREFELSSRRANLAETFNLDMSVPEAPGLALFGLDAGAAAAPIDMRSFATDLLNVAGPDGKLNAGVSIVGRPWEWLDSDLTIDQYRERAVSRQLMRALVYRTRISIATIAGDGDARRAGVGLTFQLLDYQDPRWDFGGTPLPDSLRQPDSSTEADLRTHLAGLRAFARQGSDFGIDTCITVRQRFASTVMGLMRDHGESVEDAASHYNSGEFGDVVDGGLRTEIVDFNRRCLDSFQRRRAATPSWLLSVGQAYLSPTGDIDNLNPDGLSVWTSYTHPFGVHRTGDGGGRQSSVTLYGRYTEKQSISFDDTDQLAEANTSVAAVSFNLQKLDRWEGRLQISYHNDNYVNDAIEDREYSEVAASVAFHATDSMWLRAEYGARDTSDDDNYFRLSLIYRGPDPAQ